MEHVRVKEGLTPCGTCWGLGRTYSLWNMLGSRKGVLILGSRKDVLLVKKLGSRKGVLLVKMFGSRKGVLLVEHVGIKEGCTPCERKGVLLVEHVGVKEGRTPCGTCWGLGRTYSLWNMLGSR